MHAAVNQSVDFEVRSLLRALYPGARGVSVRPLRPDVASDSGDDRGDGTTKAMGFGAPFLVHVTDGTGVAHDLVFHTAAENQYGHDRRADRADEILLAWDSFNQVPRHARAVDVGAITRDDRLISLRDAGEFYLVTEYVPGQIYAEDLRRIAGSGAAAPSDFARIEALARYLVELHRGPPPAPEPARPAAYRRAIRDLVGHGECIFGIADSYPEDTPAAPPERIAAIERACLEWRFRLRDRFHRLRPTHGDFHPFNIVFQDGAEFRVLDASRGSQGDPADDVSALCINFPFFALPHPHNQGWRDGCGALFRRFFDVYLEESGDDELLDVIAPFLAFRGLVVCNPWFYPALVAADRDKLLGFIEQALFAPRFDPESAGALFPSS